MFPWMGTIGVFVCMEPPVHNMMEPPQGYPIVPDSSRCPAHPDGDMREHVCHSRIV